MWAVVLLMEELIGSVGTVSSVGCGARVPPARLSGKQAGHAHDDVISSGLDTHSQQQHDDAHGIQQKSVVNQPPLQHAWLARAGRLQHRFEQKNAIQNKNKYQCGVIGEVPR
jgi:hypothetical protein